MFVVDNLDLVVGEQSLVLGAMGLTTDHQLKLVARVVKQNRGGDFLPYCKFAFDPTNGTVYVKVENESDATLMAGVPLRLLVKGCHFIVLLV